MKELIAEVERLAKKKAGGHFTLMKFTTGYKAFLGTMNLDMVEMTIALSKLPQFETAEGALSSLLINSWHVNDLKPTDEECKELFLDI